jgi:hypothetical protein
MTMRWVRWAILSGVLLATGCSITRVSDTGYTGTWSRGGAMGTSTISIAKTGDQYRFHWKLTSPDRKWFVTCDKNSHCEEILNGLKISEYQFSTRVDPASGHLIIEGAQKIFNPKGEVVETRIDIDELIVEEKGLKLGSYTIERNGTKMPRGEGPFRHFDKVSNSVMEPGS